jgi:hypothetical protein
MLHEYVIKLMDNLPDNITKVKEPMIIDLVLDGGMFNGSYLIGALYFLKEMENKKYIKINRISGCSIGSVAAFLYYIDGLDLISTLYETINVNFKKTHNLHSIKKLKQYLDKSIPPNICELVNNKLYISYNNIKKGTKIIKSTYKNTDDIINTIIKSCYIPFLIDGNILYENKYIDGINPYIFKVESTTKILYLDLFGFDKIGNLLNVKNEKTNFHRILSGLLDIHLFFIKQSNTQLCSYVNEWSIINNGFYYFKHIIERICIYMIYVIMAIPHNISDTILGKISRKIFQDIFIILLEHYCL